MKIPQNVIIIALEVVQLILEVVNGKSDLVAQACNDAGADLIINHPAVSDPTDYKGLPFPVADKDEATFLLLGDLLKLINADSPTLFFLDDLGRAPASVHSAVMQLILARRVNGHKVSEHVVFLAATNRREDKAGVMGILEPVKSRFAAIVELEVDADDWVAWAFREEMPAELIASGGISKTELHKALGGKITAAQLNPALDALVKAEVLSAEKETTSSKPRTVYRKYGE